MFPTYPIEKDVRIIGKKAAQKAIIAIIPINKPLVFEPVFFSFVIVILLTGNKKLFSNNIYYSIIYTIPANPSQDVSRNYAEPDNL